MFRKKTARPPIASKRIFISYRRSDSAGHAGRLYDYLKNYFGADRIFFDVDTIQPGSNFEQRINNELDNSEAVLALIGNQWLESKDKDGKRRLDNPHDYVRFEVETALGKNITVIPLLLHGTQMPSPNTLPDTLHDLSMRNAIRLNDDHWNSDCKMLASILKNTLDISKSLKERKIRRYGAVVLILSLLVFLLAELFQYYRGNYTLNFWTPVLLALLVPVNVALVTYLLGNLKKELDRLSWVIIGMAITGSASITLELSGMLHGTLLVGLTMLFVAGLLFFVEPDE